MSGSKGKSEEQTSSFVDPAQSPFLDLLRRQGLDLSNQQQAGGSQFQQNVLNPSLSAFQQIVGGPSENPFLQGQIQQGQNLLNRNLTENLLPSIGGAAAGAGQLGGSRQGVAQGIALRGTQEAGANFSENLIGQDFQQQRQQQLQALGLAGNIGGLAFSPLQNLQQLIGRPTILSQGDASSKDVSASFL